MGSCNCGANFEENKQQVKQEEERMRPEGLGLKGRFEFIHRDKDGNVKQEKTILNIIVNGGKAQVAGLILSDIGGTAFDYIAIGEGASGPSATDTALGSESHRGAGTGTRTTTTVTNDTAQLVYTFNFSSSYAITEAGIFNAASGPLMLCRTVFSAINVVNGDSLQVTYKVVVS